MENRVHKSRLFSGVPAQVLPKPEPLLARKKQKVESPSEQEHSCTGSSSPGRDDPQTILDCENRILGPNHEQKRCLLPGNGLIRVEEGDKDHEKIKQKLLSGLMSLGMDTTIESIEKNDFSSSMKRAKLLVFSLFAKAVEKKSGVGNGNVQFAWFGASKKEISSILQHGFAPSTNIDGSSGHGVYLCPDNFPLGCMNSAAADENGVRHLLYCRVILGKTEVVRPGSRQWHPSSQEFDCGVDDLVSPRKYIVWSTNINTHILPQYMISFRISSLNGIPRKSVSLKKPNSPWISFAALVSQLTKFLSPQIMQLITKYVEDHKKGKMARLEMVRHLRRLAGDELLTKIVKAQKDKQINASIGFPANNTGVRRNC